MKIKSVRIQNLRSFVDVGVQFDDYTSIVGPNGAGKSTILCALNIFFRELDGSTTNLLELDAEDFHLGDTKTPIEITITFSDLNDDAQKEFSGYYRNGALIVTARATYDEVARAATVQQFGQRLAMEAFAPFFKLYNDGGKAGDLSKIYQEIATTYTDLPKPGSKDANRDALRNYEEAHPELCILIPSPDQFYGFSKGSNRLARFVQWVYIPAVKDATKENVESKNTALGKLLARTVRSKVKFDDELSALRSDTLDKYRTLIEAQQSALNEISTSLTARLSEWAHPEATARLTWTEDPKTSVRIEEPIARLLAGEGLFEGDLARFGHGLQRSYLLALLQELASSDDTNAPRLILGCEEPELYQHPPQARHLANVFQKLSSENSQIIVSTHSPHFISGAGFPSVRLVRRNNVAKRSEVSWVPAETIAQRYSEVTGETKTPVAAQIARLHQALQPHLNEMFFTPCLVFVEGLEDIAYLMSWMTITGRIESYRKCGCHIVPVNGKSNLIEPIIVANKLGIPCFSMFDADGNKTKPDERKRHEIDNKALLRLLGGNEADPFPTTPIFGTGYIVWPINFGEAIKLEVGQSDWDKSFGEATKGLGSPSGSYTKNTLHIAGHLSILHRNGVKPTSLELACDTILKSFC